MDLVGTFLKYPLAFLAVITVVAFVHEFGHYWVARRCGVRVEKFSIFGWGPELFGWNDRNGTRWCFSAIPVGAFVKFYGDADGASTPDAAVNRMTEEQRRVSFHHKTLGQKAAIVAAGPLANFIFAILVYAALFSVIGQAFTPAVVGGVNPGSAAEQAGLRPGDRILAVDGTPVQRFEELRQIVSIAADERLRITVERDGERLVLVAVPRRVETDDGFGGRTRVGQLGVVGGKPEFVVHPPHEAVWQAMRQTWGIVTGSLNYLRRIVQGSESGDQLAGPLGMAHISGEVASLSLLNLVALVATLSVGIGLINLFPIPLLDGGHLLFYAVEAVRGRPLGERAQEYGFRVGAAFVLTLMLFATWNDLNRLQVWNYVAALFS